MKKNFVILLLLLINQWIFADRDIEYIIREDGVYCGFSGKFCKIEDADPATFIVEIPAVPYAKDRNNVYWCGKKLPDANVATFRRLMNTDFGSDDKHVYYRSEKLYGANPASFSVLKHNLGVDERYIYSNASVLDSLRADFSYYANFIISGDDVFIDLGDLDAKTVEIIKSKNHSAMNKYDEYMNGEEEPVHQYFNIYDDDIRRNNGSNLKHADMKTFEVLDGFYAKDTTNVFCVFNKIFGADPETFELLHAFTGKDKRAVYSGWNEILLADPNSFEMMNQRYGKDDAHVFFDASKISGADVSTFTPINDYYAKDKNTAYFKYARIEGSDPHSFSASKYLYPYSKDKYAVYYKTQKIENADPASFVVLHHGYSKDKNTVFLYTSVIPEADPATFKWIVGTDYSVDRKHVFLERNKIENSDGMSFRVLNDDYCLDKNQVYYHGQKTGADPESFQPLNTVYSKDNRNVFYKTVKIDGADLSSFKVGGESDYSFAYDNNYLYFHHDKEEIDIETFEIDEHFRTFRDKNHTFRLKKTNSGGLIERDCYLGHEVDTYPVYMDTIPFRDYILKSITYPYPDGSFQARIMLTVNIDTCGRISNFDFIRDADCLPCRKNILETLENAKPFIPATRDDKSVCFSSIIMIPYGYFAKPYQSQFFWYLSPEDSSIIDVLYTDMEFTEFLDKDAGCKDCISVGQLDELPVYQDTISFEKYINESRKPLFWKYNDKGRYVVAAEIDTLGELSHIRILDDNAHCEECLANVYEILKTAKPFTPGRKDGQAVRTSVIFSIPYNERIHTFLNPLYEYLNPRDWSIEKNSIEWHRGQLTKQKRPEFKAYAHRFINSMKQKENNSIR